MTHPSGLHIIVAPTGSGKSMYMMQRLGFVLAHTERNIVTNLPLKWEGLMEVMNEEFPNTNDGKPWTVQALKKRIWHCLDIPKFRRYWQHRGFGWTLIDIDEKQYEEDLRPDWSVAFRYNPRVEKDGRERIPLYRLRMPAILELERAGEVIRRSMEDLPPVEYLIDEAGDIFPKQSKAKLGPAFPYYQAHKRKIGSEGDNTLMACQYPKQVDLELREQANDWVFLVNWAARRKWFFSLPKKATWSSYPTLPSKGDGPMLTGFFQIDGKTWGRTYDTSAGVGIGGGLKADVGQSVGGISWMWIFPAMLAVIVLLHYSPTGISGAMTWFLHRKRPAPEAVQIQTNQPPVAVAAIAAPPVQESPLKKLLPKIPTEEIEDYGELSGFMSDRKGNVLRIFWRNGMETTSGDPQFQGAIRRGSQFVGVKWAGKTYYLKTATPFANSAVDHQPSRQEQ